MKKYPRGFGNGYTSGSGYGFGRGYHANGSGNGYYGYASGSGLGRGDYGYASGSGYFGDYPIWQVTKINRSQKGKMMSWIDKFLRGRSI